MNFINIIQTPSEQLQKADIKPNNKLLSDKKYGIDTQKLINSLSFSPAIRSPYATFSNIDFGKGLGF